MIREGTMIVLSDSDPIDRIRIRYDTLGPYIHMEIWVRGEKAGVLAIDRQEDVKEIAARLIGENPTETKIRRVENEIHDDSSRPSVQRSGSL